MIKNFDEQGNNCTYIIFLRLVFGVAVYLHNFSQAGVGGGDGGDGGDGGGGGD